MCYSLQPSSSISAGVVLFEQSVQGWPILLLVSMVNERDLLWLRYGEC